MLEQITINKAFCFLVVSESGEIWSQYKGIGQKNLFPKLRHISGPKQKKKTLTPLVVEDSCVSSCASSHRVKKGSDNQAKDFQRELQRSHGSVLEFWFVGRCFVGLFSRPTLLLFFFFF